MEIVSIEKKTFEEMKERFGCFSQHVRELCARYRPPEKMNWMDGADVCEKLGISKRTLQTYRDRGCCRTARSTTRFTTGRRMWRRSWKP